MRLHKLLVLFTLTTAFTASADRWHIADDQKQILWNPSVDIPHQDCVEMTGETTSLVLRWGIDSDGAFRQEKALVFPLLRTVPDNTHASLVYRMATDIPSMITVDGTSLQGEKVRQVAFEGTLTVTSDWKHGDVRLGISGKDGGQRDIAMTRTIFPSTTGQHSCERYVIRNLSSWRTYTINIPEFGHSTMTDPAKGTTGSYVLQCGILGNGRYSVAPGDSVVFNAVYRAYRENEQPEWPDVADELACRRSLIAEEIGRNLILETPDSVINTEFHFSKLRASESIIRTAGGLMHAPGGEVFYAAIWTNDQCEYVIPFYPYLGYATGNKSALNTFGHYARFMNDDYKPLPSSIISEGRDIWNGVGDRGDAAMCANGATRYALARADKDEALQLWPLIEWCLEYCRRNLTADGVVASDTDELENRIPVGRTNLATSSLYYDALLSAAYLGDAIGKDSSLTRRYRAEAKELARNIERFFGRDIDGFHTYRYSEANDKLRAWMCMPIVVDIPDRRRGTVDALLSPKLFSTDGLLTQEGDSVFWDRSSLYALRGIFRAGQSDRAIGFLHDFSRRRLLGDHVPYFIEAWPEGSGAMRQLSAEGGLYCRIFIEGLFGIRPTGFDSFDITPSLPGCWNNASLRNIRAFGRDFDIELRRLSDGRIETSILQDGKKPLSYKIKPGNKVSVKFK